MKKTLSILTSAVFLVIGLILVSAPACAQTWTGYQVSTNNGETLLCLASSADGTTLVVGSGSSDESDGSTGKIFISTNSGVTWQPTLAPSNWWTAVACSADGTKILAVNLGSNSPICTSSDSGDTWIPRSSPILGGYGAASSADGTKLVVIGTYGAFPIRTGLFLSGDAGATWALANAGTTNLGWSAVASSADGTHLAATSGGTGLTNYIYVSSDSGNSWARANVFSQGWTSIASSADGSKLVAVGLEIIYTSDDYGVTWQSQSNPAQQFEWISVASSADGARLLLGGEVENDPLYSSFDSGLTWVTNDVPSLEWQAVASSADGVKLAALPFTIGDAIATVQLADIDASIVATPKRVDLQDMIQVTLTITNETTNAITNVQVSGSITVSGSGGAAFTGFSGPSVVPTLPPATNATLIYMYQATNYGMVNFKATVVGNGPLNPIYSLPGISRNVAIYPNCDLMVKTAATNDTNFRGVGEYQQSPSGDQRLSLAVGTNGGAQYIVRVQNNSRGSRTFLLNGYTNATENWNLQVVANNVNILGDLTSSDGWTTPSLAAGAYVDLQVSLAPSTNAGLLAVQSVRLAAMPDSSNNFVLDTVLLRAALVPVPVQVNPYVLDGSGLSAESIQAGLTDIDAPLVPVTDPNVLDLQRTIFGGLVADGVTPLLIRLYADPDSLTQFPAGLGFSIQPTTLGVGALNGTALNQRFQYLQNGAWQPLTPSTSIVLSQTNNVGYVQLLPIASDDLLFGGLTNELGVDFSVVDSSNAVQCGDLQFAIRKPPIALIHGYNTTGDWGADFKNILGASRPFTEDVNNNFIVTVKYGQDTTNMPPGLPGLPVYVNTVASVDDCVQMALQSFESALAPLHDEWAFTRFDVVAHSQGGVLTRMLCNVAGNDYITQPFRNASNFNRGRFHRVVTVGSPHNGTRLLRYLLDLNQEGKFAAYLSVPLVVGLLGVQSAVAQAKFDPFGPEFAEVNNPDPNAPWQPDPAAAFHLVRTVIDNGASPGTLDFTPSYLVLGLTTSLGGASVIPRGSDGVVDFDSMAANVPPAPVASNVFTLPASIDISHAGPTQVFGSTSFQTESTDVAQHVIGALDQVSYLPPSDIVFGSFLVPPLLSSSTKAAIDNYANSVTIQAIENLILQVGKLDAQTNYTYQINFPTNLPPDSDVAWVAQVYGPSGITSDGVEISEGGTNNNQVTLTVDNALVGDVVLSASYMSANNTLVVTPPILVVSLPSSGPAMTGFQLIPSSIALSVGSVISPQFLATYSDGSSSLRFVATNAIATTSSQPAVVAVSNALNWLLSTVGTAQVTVSWSGFQATSQITVFDPASTNAPPLSLVNQGNGQLTVSWPGFTTSYQLQSTADLSNTNSWQTVPTTPIMAGGESFLTFSATDTQQFYRLQWQQ